LNHIHLKSTPSTQDYILENFEQAKEGILVSADEQTHGKGQYDRSWKHFEGSLSFSLTLIPNKIITLTSLEIPVLLQNFLTKRFGIEILFKWPNDLLTNDGKKFGGILINRQGDNDLIVGLGLNLWPIHNTDDFLYTASGLFDQEIEFNSKELSRDIYKFILENRMESPKIIKDWNQSCIHLNKEVKIKESAQDHIGIFKGIGSNGQAMLEQHGVTKEIYTGSLLF